MALQLIAAKGRLAARALGVERARDQLLAGPALAADQHGDVGPRHAPDRVEDLAHGGAVPDDLRQGRRARLGGLGPQRLAVQPGERRRPLEDRGELLEVDRLGDVVVRAQSDRPHGALVVRVARQHHDLQPGVVPQQLLEQPQALGRAVGIRREAEVQGDGIEAAVQDRAARLVARRGEDHVEARLEPPVELRPDLVAVVDDKDACALLAGFLGLHDSFAPD